MPPEHELMGIKISFWTREGSISSSRMASIDHIKCHIDIGCD